jgi:hypothetical protein
MFRKMRFLLILCVLIGVVDLLEDSGYQKNLEESMEILDLRDSGEKTEMGVEATTDNNSQDEPEESEAETPPFAPMPISLFKVPKVCPPGKYLNNKQECRKRYE